MALFGPKIDHLAEVARHLGRLVELYELDLRSRGITTQGADGVGEIYLTSPEFLEQEEQNNVIRTYLGLSPTYDVGGALPTGSAGFGPTAEAARKARDEAPPFPPFQPGFIEEAYSTPWGVGPEGAEKPKEHADG